MPRQHRRLGALTWDHRDITLSCHMASLQAKTPLLLKGHMGAVPWLRRPGVRVLRLTDTPHLACNSPVCHSGLTHPHTCMHTHILAHDEPSNKR